MKIVFLTGAGISAESGLSTFRGRNGLWNDEGLQVRASADFFYENPALSLEFYNWRRLQLSKVEPNPAHKILAWLEQSYDVSVITQNVDNLHERAGSKRVLHLHGELCKVCSANEPNDSRYIKEYPLDMPIKVGDKSDDGAQLRPFVVMFGEYVPNMEFAIQEIAQADIVVVVGSSLKVYPAASLVEYAKPDAVKIVIDPVEQEMCQELGFIQIQDTASNGMVSLCTNHLGIDEVPSGLKLMPIIREIGDFYSTAQKSSVWSRFIRCFKKR